jgi:hypothetical protein
VDGVQLQSAPEFELSFKTVAATDAVAPGFIVVGGAIVNVTEVDPEVLTGTEEEPTAPHPEKVITKRNRIIFARSVTLKVLRAKSTRFSLVEM